MAALVGGFCRYIRADDFTVRIVDLFGYRCFVAVNHLHDISDNLEINFGDMSISVLIQRQPTHPHASEQRRAPERRCSPPDDFDPSPPRRAPSAPSSSAGATFDAEPPLARQSPTAFWSVSSLSVSSSAGRAVLDQSAGFTSDLISNSNHVSMTLSISMQPAHPIGRRTGSSDGSLHLSPFSKAPCLPLAINAPVPVLGGLLSSGQAAVSLPIDLGGFCGIFHSREERWRIFFRFRQSFSKSTPSESLWSLFVSVSDPGGFGFSPTLSPPLKPCDSTSLSGPGWRPNSGFIPPPPGLETCGPNLALLLLLGHRPLCSGTGLLCLGHYPSL
uniref:Uncharacterized protein n=1 Tax=Ananas comosus var. bracteatus TaxID=296719 RepID=A0A6V7P300_ANACO|nr:unnamed protein product [Ananas comosus var. bracteatus]